MGYLLLKVEDPLVDFVVSCRLELLLRFQSLQSLSEFGFFLLFNLLLLRSLALNHAEHAHRQRVVHQVLNHVVRYHLHVLGDVVKLRLLVLLDHFCLVGGVVVGVFAHDLVAIFVWNFSHFS